MSKRLTLLGVVLTLLLLLGIGLGEAERASAASNPFNQKGSGIVLNEVHGESASARYIIQFAAPPLASYAGGIADLAPTKPELRGETRLNSANPESVAYLAYLEREQTTFISRMEAVLGREVEIVFQYQHALNGMAVVLTPAEAASVARLPGVKQVTRDFDRYLQTDVGPQWIGAPTIWNGTSTGGLPGTKGEGIVVGIIDSGINTDHPSFAEVGPVDGYVHTNPRGIYYGLCLPLTGLPFCNDKLIGVYDFTGTLPEDDNGHGSHTASTTAGNVVNADVIAPTITVQRTLSGVAPHANIIAYKACVTVPPLPPEIPPPPIEGTCPLSGIVASINQATIDQVDVINFSIGGGSSDPYSITELDSQAFLAARNAGVFVATSAGNEGPGEATIGSPADAPWVMSVGAATHNRSFVNALVALTGGNSTPPGDIQGRSFTAGYGPAPLVYAGDFGDPLCENAATDYPDGSIVLCDRGVNGRVEKAENVAAGGAGGYVLANDEANGGSLTADMYPIPGVHITYEDGVVLKAWVASGGNPTGTIAGTTAETDDTLGDVMASFSSRGPNPSVPGVIKPDLMGPGVDILAAVNTPLGSIGGPAEFGLLSGTSMSSPHAAGAAALIRDLHPDWTPAEVQSALMTTAFNGPSVRKEDGLRPADPFDMGAGRLDLTVAARAGLVLDETDYESSNPASGGDPSTLNIPSLANPNCVTTCSWTRTVSSSAASVTWTATTTDDSGLTLSVSPSSFTLAPGATQTIQITADVSSASIGEYIFGEVRLEPNTPSIPDAHFPVAVLPAGIGGVLQRVNIEASDSVGIEVITMTSPLPAPSLSAELFGLTPGLLVERQIPQDPTLLDPYDLPVGTFFVTTTVPAGARFMLAEILETTASDVDLFVGTGTTPSEATEVCRSATSGPAESCRLEEPAAGIYWILVQNWLTGQVLDTVVLQTAIIPGTYNDNWNVMLAGQQLQGGPSTIDLEVAYFEPEMDGGEVWFGFAELSAGDTSPTSIGSLLVRIQRQPGPTSVELSDFAIGGGAATPWLALGIVALALFGLLALRQARRSAT